MASSSLLLRRNRQCAPQPGLIQRHTSPWRTSRLALNDMPALSNPMNPRESRTLGPKATGARGSCIQSKSSRFPSQVCHDYNTVAHLNDYEGRPGRRPFTYGELQHLFDFLDARVERIRRSGRKGAWAALRDAQMVKTCYAYGLRRRELCMLDVADLRPNPHMRQWGTFGAVHVRYGKATRGGTPRRRTVLTVPEFDWVVDGLRQWVEHARPLLQPDDLDALWLTERRQRISAKSMDNRFAWLREQAGLAADLSLHCLRHSYVTHLIEFGYPERFVTEQVGHSYASTTAIYTSVSNDFKTKTLKAALARVYMTEEER